MDTNSKPVFKRDEDNQKPIEELDSLKTKVTIQGNEIAIKISYEGKFGLGYDGCGTHTHK